MIRKIIHIDSEKCNGCGACVTACHEGAIVLRQGKAVLLRDDYCDGLGDCLPACPTGAISFEEREALPYDEAAVLAKMREKNAPLACGCPGSETRTLTPQTHPSRMSQSQTDTPSRSCLGQWPVQIKLVPANAAFLTNADILVAADCAAYAHASFHQDFMAGKVTLIGCPKLDNINYADKLSAIFSENPIRSITVARMTVPCCQELVRAVARAVDASGKDIAISVATITPEGGVSMGSVQRSVFE